MLTKVLQSEIFLYLTKNQLQSKKITYTYDSMNRRVARTDEKGTTQYLYGNPNHPFQLTAVRSPSGTLSNYHYDDFGLLFALERDNNWYYITTDQLGTPRVVCDANGEVVKILEYDSFGKLMTDTNPEFELHISFAGGLIDVETELVRFGFRDYDTVAGKWTAKDPIGFEAGDSNLYRYVFNASISFIDPSGLQRTPGNQVSRRFYPSQNLTLQEKAGIHGLPVDLWNYVSAYATTNKNIQIFNEAKHSIGLEYQKGSQVDGTWGFYKNPLGFTYGFEFFPDINGEIDPRVYHGISPRGDTREIMRGTVTGTNSNPKCNINEHYQ